MCPDVAEVCVVVNIDLLISTGLWLSGLGMTGLGVEMTLDRRAPERKMVYRFAFCALGAIFIALSYKQSDISEKRARELAEKHQQEELRSEGNVKYVQGQLDSVNKVLGILAANSDPKQVAAALNGILPKTIASAPTGLQPPAIERMTNKQLRDQIIDFCGQLRQFVKQQDDRETTANNSFREQERAAKDQTERQKLFQEEIHSFEYRHNQMKYDFNSKYKASAIMYRDELIRRLGPQPPASTTGRETAALDSDFVDTRFLDDTAAYLENLARKLTN